MGMSTALHEREGDELQYISLRAAVPFYLPDDMRWRFWMPSCLPYPKPLNNLQIDSGRRSNCANCPDVLSGEVAESVGCGDCQVDWDIVDIQNTDGQSYYCFEQTGMFGQNEVFLLNITAYLIPVLPYLPDSFLHWDPEYDTAGYEGAGYEGILKHMYSKKRYQVMIRKRTSVDGVINGTIKSILETSIMSVDFQHDIKLTIHEDCQNWETEGHIDTLIPGEPMQMYVRADPAENIQNIERLEVETFKQIGRFGLEFVFIAGGIEKYDKLFAQFVFIGDDVCIQFVPMSNIKHLNNEAQFYVSGILVIGTAQGAAGGNRLRRLDQEVRRRGLQGALQAEASNQEAEITVTLVDSLAERGASFDSQSGENQMQAKKFPFAATMAVVASVIITAALVVLGIVVHAASSSSSAAAVTSSKQ